MIGGLPSKATKPEVILRVAARIEHAVVLRQIGGCQCRVWPRAAG